MISNVENALPLVRLEPSVATKLASMSMALIRGVIYHSQSGFLEFWCETYYDQHSQSYGALCEIPPQEIELACGVVDSERKEIKCLVQEKLAYEFERWASGAESILTPLLDEVPLKVYDELR